MKRVAPSAGFTIVETMIVLAVTGFMFMAVSVTWGGKQHKSDYQTAVRDVTSIIQQTVSDVQNGYFPSTDNFSCIGTSANLRFPSTPSTAKQGGNTTCQFMGKALEFRVSSDSPELMRKYTVAGWSNAGSDPPTSIAATQPTLAPRLTETLKLPFDLTTSSITVNGSGGYVGVAFLIDVGSTTDSTGQLDSGRQVVKAYGLKSVLNDNDGLPIDGTFGLSLLSSNIINPATPLTSGMQICMRSGGTQHFAVITIGEGGNITNVKSETRSSC